jgi:hypothetical protein
MASDILHLVSTPVLTPSAPHAATLRHRNTAEDKEQREKQQKKAERWVLNRHPTR